MQSIEGKIAWVTGAGTGIGRAGAMALAEAGAKVILSGRRVAQLEAVASRIADAGGSVEIEVLDIVDTNAVDAYALALFAYIASFDPEALSAVQVHELVAHLRLLGALQSVPE